MARRALPSQARNHLSARLYQILQVLAHRLLIAEIVILLHQAVEQRLFRRAPHLHKFKRSETAKRSANRTVIGDHRLGPLHAPLIDSAPAFHRRQLDLPRTVKHQQESAAYHVAQRAVGLLPLPSFTKLPRQLPSAQFRMLSISSRMKRISSVVTSRLR